MRGQTTLDFAVGVSIFLVVVAFVVAFVPTMLEPFEGGSQEETAMADRLADDLVTDLLAEDVRNPYLLDRECTVVFFESREDGNDPAGDDEENVDGDDTFTDPFGTGFGGSCGFSDIPFRDRLGLDGDDPNVRIRLVADLTDPTLDDPDGNEADPDNGVAEVLCIDDNSDDRIVEGGDPTDDSDGAQCDITGDDDDIVFSIGESPPTERSSVVVARRVVSFEGGFGDGNTDATLVVEMW